MKYLVQLLLPLRDNDGQQYDRDIFSRVRRELVEEYGGLTSYSRAPAEGLWAEAGSPPTFDELVVYEIMADRLDRDHWSAYRKELEGRFRQEVIVIRALKMDLL